MNFVSIAKLTACFSCLLAFNLGSIARAELISIDSLKSNWASTLGGAATTIVVHELGHYIVAETEGVEAYFDGFTIKYRDINGSDQQALRLSSAGYQAQWLVSEYGFMRLNQKGLNDRRRAWNAGLVLGHIGISAAYLVFLKNNEDGDASGVARSTGLSVDQVVALLSIPAVLDSWRLFGKHSPKWASWTSRGFKVVGITATWQF